MVKISKPFATNADEAPAYWQIGNLWQAMATGVQTDNAFTLLDQVVHSGGGGGPVTHIHAQDEGLYVIKGKCTFNGGGTQGIPGPPGTFVSIPGNTEHSFTVDEPDTHILNFYLPAGFEQLLIGISHPAPEHKPPPPETIGPMMAPPWLADKLSEMYGETSVLGNPFVDAPDPKKMFTKATAGATLFPFRANASELGENFMGMNGCWSILASGKQTGGLYCLLEVKFQKGLVVGPRVYREKDEMYYVFGGEMTFLLGDRIETAKMGSLVYIPSGTVYSVRVDSSEGHCLNLHTQSGFDELVELCGVRGKGAFAAPSNKGKIGNDVDAGTRERLMSKIGLTDLSKHLQVQW